MSQRKEGVGEDIDPELSSNDLSQLSSSATSDGSSGSDGSNSTTGTTGSSCNTNECKHSRQSRTSDQESKVHTCPKTALPARNQSDLGLAVGTATEERKATVIKREDVIQRSQSTTGRKCDTSIKDLKTSCPSSPRFEVERRDELRQFDLANLGQPPSTSSQPEHTSVDRHAVRPTPSASSSLFDTNNNKNSSASNIRVDHLSGPRRSNFSKSASGSRLVNRNDIRSKVCDCLSQQCGEKQHSSRRKFIENYYNSRTRLPSSTAISALNISSPLNRLSECDAITKRLLSSPIRTVNLSENRARQTKIGEVDKSRRASLGTNTLTEQVSLYTASQFNSLELNYGKELEKKANDHLVAYDPTRQSATEGVETRQQQARSFSMCQDDCLPNRFKLSGPNHSSNFNRAVSLACEFGAPRQMMTIIPLFGCDMKALEQFVKWGLVLPPAIDSAADHILLHGVESIGIFRKSGVKSRILTLKHRIETNQEATLEQINKDNEFSIYDIADLVKMWFRELKPMPIMTKDLIRLISGFLQSSGSSGMQATSSQFNPHQDRLSRDLEFPAEDARLKEQVDSIISPTHKALFFKTLKFFASISSKSEINQMTSQNLAICLAPSLCATESDQTSILVAQRALKYCIDNYKILF